MAPPARLVVVCGRSAASVGELVGGLKPLGDLVFLLDTSPYNDPLRALLAQVGTVLDVAPTAAATADLLRPLRPDGIVTFSESLLPLTASLAAALELPFHSPDDVTLLTDKYEQRRRLRERGADTVRTHLLTSSSEWPSAVRKVGLPAVLKPVRGEGSRNTHVVSEDAEGQALVHDLLDSGREPALVLEEFLAGRESGAYAGYVSVESLASRGVVTHLAVTGKHPMMAPFRETGQFWPSALDPAEERDVLDLASRAIDALGVRTGLLHTEIILTADGPHVIEVNGRLGGLVNDLAVRAAGVSLVRLAGQVALGEHVVPEPVKPREVCYQFTHLAPIERVRFLKADGHDVIRRMPGVDTHRPLVRAGDWLDGGTGWTMLDLLTGRAASHGEMSALIDQALDTVEFTFATPGGDIETLSGRACSPWAAAS